MPEKNGDTAEICPKCDGAVTTDFDYCPHCGHALHIAPNNFEEAFRNLIKREKELERTRSQLWSPAFIYLYLFGMTLLIIPDVLVMALFHNKLAGGYAEIPQFIISDAFIGVIAILLIRIGACKGVTGELVLGALRGLQIPLTMTLDINPFGADREILSFVMFGLVPAVIYGSMALVFNIHITTLMDKISIAYSKRNTPPSSDNRE